MKKKKLLMHSAIANSLQTSFLIFYNNNFTKNIDTRSIGVSYPSFKFLKIFKSFKSTDFKFPLRVIRQDLKNFKSNSLSRSGVSVRYNTFLLKDVGYFIFLQFNDSQVLIFFMFLSKPNLNFYKICCV